MRTIFTITLALLLVSAKLDSKLHFVSPKIEVVEASLEEQLAPLLEALIIVESQGENIVGDNGNAVGILQIWKIQVDECNRVAEIMGRPERFTYEDRWDEEKSKEMFFIIVEYWHKESGYDWEEISRCWNGGPNGMRLKKTEWYWTKVKRVLDEQEQIAQR